MSLAPVVRRLGAILSSDDVDDVIVCERTDGSVRLDVSTRRTADGVSKRRRSVAIDLTKAQRLELVRILRGST